MAYCRCGDDSDVYVIKDMSGSYITYVAGGDMSFKDTSLTSLRDRLLSLRSTGLKVPDRVFTRINEESEK